MPGSTCYTILSEQMLMQYIMYVRICAFTITYHSSPSYYILNARIMTGSTCYTILSEQDANVVHYVCQDICISN